MDNFVRRYRIVLLDQNKQKWYLILRENKNQEEYRIRATLPRIDSRTTDFTGEQSLLSKIQKQAYQVIVTNSKKTKITLEGESVSVDRLIILESYAPKFEEVLRSKHCVLKKLENTEFNRIMIEYSENGGLSYEPVLYSDNPEIKALATANQYSSTVSFNDPFVTKVYNTFMRDVLRNINKNEIIRFLTGEGDYRNTKYADKNLINSAYNYMMNTNPSYALDVEQELKNCFTSYKVVRDLWVGMETYKAFKQIPELIDVPREDTIKESTSVYSEPIEHDDVTKNQYSLFELNKFKDDNDQGSGGTEKEQVKSLGEMPR